MPVLQAVDALTLSHRLVSDLQEHQWCQQCFLDWPCPTMRVVERYQALHATLTRLLEMDHPRAMHEAIASVLHGDE